MVCCQNSAWWASYCVWIETGLTSNCTGLALNLDLRDMAWQPHWLWYDIGLTSNCPRIGTGFLLIWRSCDEDWNPNYFLSLRLCWHWIGIRLTMVWQSIGKGLANYWYRIVTWLTQDWHRIKTGLSLYWCPGDEVWQSIGFRLTPDWQ